MTQFIALRPNIYSYLTDDNDKSKKAKDIKKFVMKGKLKFWDYKNFLEANQLEKKLNYQVKNKLAINSQEKIKKN